MLRRSWARLRGLFRRRPDTITVRLEFDRHYSQVLRFAGEPANILANHTAMLLAVVVARGDRIERIPVCPVAVRPGDAIAILTGPTGEWEISITEGKE